MKAMDLEGYWETTDEKYSLQFRFSEELDAGGIMIASGKGIPEEELSFDLLISKDGFQLHTKNKKSGNVNMTAIKPKGLNIEVTIGSQKLIFVRQVR